MSMSTSSKTTNNATNEADIIFNRANVALARSQRLVASWLPPKTPEELANSKSEEELQREEDELFTPVPERLGLGAPLPQQGAAAADGSWNRTELSSNDKLRQQLLGKNYRKKVPSDKDNKVVGGSHKGTVPATSAATTASASDDEEELGRSAVGRSKKKEKEKEKSKGEANNPATATMESVDDESKDKNDEAKNDDDDDNTDDDADADAGKSTSKRGGVTAAPSSNSKGKRAVGSFLDELLSDRSRKKRKRQK
ncbi:hypothetical protein VTN77DRAFT_8506 [Rasamsonia byssochlamydoides]|uniref:uncharacterized protein n=1 Tax=Rasamsonia byssochlamydoides TaxID=89139 RepID=UPI0037443C84